MERCLLELESQEMQQKQLIHLHLSMEGNGLNTHECRKFNATERSIKEKHIPDKLQKIQCIWKCIKSGDGEDGDKSK